MRPSATCGCPATIDGRASSGLPVCKPAEPAALSRAVQIGGATLGGERPGDKPGRGSSGSRVPIAAAVSIQGAGNPLCATVAALPAFSSAALSTWAQANLKPGCTVRSDGLGCFAAVTEAGCIHQAEVVGQHKPRELPQFKWVSTVLGSLKTMLTGAGKSFGDAKYAAPGACTKWPAADSWPTGRASTALMRRLKTLAL